MPQTFTYLTNHLGSSSWITDALGDVNQHLQQLPYGEDFIDQRKGSFDARYQFTGKERDQMTGFQYFGARYYNSDISVWLSVDPLADKYPSLSPYNYCAGNPIRFIDPNGMFFDEWEIDMLTGQERQVGTNGGDDTHYYTIVGIDGSVIGSTTVTGGKPNIYHSSAEHLGENYAFNYYNLTITPSVPGPVGRGGVSITQSIGSVETEIDWGQVSSASLGIVFGAMEVVGGAAGEYFSGGASTALIFDGAARIGSNAMKLGFALDGEPEMASSTPANFGGWFGKSIDNIAFNSRYYEVGPCQASLQAVNDVVTFVSLGGSGYNMQTIISAPISYLNYSSGVIGYGGGIYSMTFNLYNDLYYFKFGQN